MLPEHIRLETKQVVATALAQRMITPAHADLVMVQAAEYERRGVAHLNVTDLMVQLNLITPDQAAQLVQIRSSATASQTFTIGKYLLTNRLGAGAMGTVYLAVDQTLQRKVALKILSPQLAALPEFVGRFKKEARTTAQLSHRNIVHVYDVDELDGFLFYAMEYLEGAALDDVVKKRGRLPPEEAVPYVIQAAKGLEAAHKQGVIHRDVKPANLFLTKDGTIKLVDLGLSKDTTEAANSEHSVAGMAIGTPHYIAPEQARGLDGIDGRADIYGLGCTLYTLLTGTTPYSGPNPVAIMNKQINDPPPDPRTVVASLPAAYSILIELMMAKNPNDRYQHCTELVADLERVLAGKAPMGASVSVAAETEQDVPTVKRRAVTTSSRGPMSPLGGTGATRTPSGTGRGRAISAVALASPTGSGSSGFRRLSGTPRRATTRLDRVEVLDPAQEAEFGAEEPFHRKYAVHLGVGGGAVLVLVLVLILAGSGGDTPPTNGTEPSSTKPTASRPWGPPGTQPMPTPVVPPTPPTPPPAIKPPTGTPAAPVTPAPPPKDPGELSPYEWAKLHPTQPQPPPIAPPTPVPAPVAAPAAVTGSRPASWTKPPAGVQTVCFLDGKIDQSPVGQWERVEERTEDGIRYLRWTGRAIPNLTDLQYPYFRIGKAQISEGTYLIRGRIRRNGKNPQPLQFGAYGQGPEYKKFSKQEIHPATSSANTWSDFSLTLILPAGQVIDQFEIRTSGTGIVGETFDLEWLELNLEAAVGVAAAQAVSAGALLHHDCTVLEEGKAIWSRCTLAQEGSTAFMHWTHQGNVLPDKVITSPNLAVKQGFSWAGAKPLMLKIRIRAKGAPRFNIGVKFYYHNRNGDALSTTARIDFKENNWGTWLERSVDLEVAGPGTFDELELRPYDPDVTGGAIDIDWIEILPATP